MAAGEHGVDDGVNFAVLFVGVAKGAVLGYAVAVATAFAGDFEVAPGGEVVDDALDGVLGDADAMGDLAHAQFRIFGDREQHVGVVGEEGPLARFRLRLHEN